RRRPDGWPERRGAPPREWAKKPGFDATGCGRRRTYGRGFLRGRQRHRTPNVRERPASASNFHYCSQFTDSGCVFSHWVLSVTPEASCAQALLTAVRNASWRFVADAVRQSRLPLKLMHTCTRTRAWWNVE